MWTSTATAFGYSDALWRPTFNFRLGGTVKQVLRLGGEVFVWTNYQNGITETLVSLMPIVQVYPIRTAGLNFRGGAGFAWSSVTDNYYYGVTSGDNGFGTLVGRRLGIPGELQVLHHARSRLVPAVVRRRPPTRAIPSGSSTSASASDCKAGERLASGLTAP